MNGIYATAYHPPNLQFLQRYNVNRGMAGLGNGEFLEREAEYTKRQAEISAEWQALTPEERTAKLAAAELFKSMLAEKESARLIMNSQAPIARLPLPAYQNKMRLAILAADFEAFNMLLVISKFGWSANAPLGMYRFKFVNGKRIYVPFSDVDLANLFQYMSLAVNRFGYNRFAEPGATCDWKHLLDLYVNRQDVAKKQYPNTDWRHVVEIYPGRYICQVYRPSTWVKIRKPVVAAVLIVAAIYLGPIVLGKIGEAGAAEAAGAAATTAEAGTAITAVAIETATVASTVTTVASTAGVVTTAAEAGSLFATAQQVVGYVNQARTIDAIIKGELPPPPISLSGGSFTEWAYDLAKAEVISEAKQRAMELGQEYLQKDLSKAEEARIRAEILIMQQELAALLPPGTPIMPSPELAADVRQKIAAMQEIERQRQQQQNIVLMALAAGGAFLAFG